MAIRMFRKYEIICDRCENTIGEFGAFTASEEDGLLTRPMYLCMKCSTKPLLENNSNPTKKRGMTEEQEIILDAWTQFAHEVVRKDGKRIGFYSGALSTLETIEYYLRRNELINKFGNPTKKATR